jgi:hypothetical protein
MASIHTFREIRPLGDADDPLHIERRPNPTGRKSHSATCPHGSSGSLVRTSSSAPRGNSSRGADRSPSAGARTTDRTTTVGIACASSLTAAPDHREDATAILAGQADITVIIGESPVIPKGIMSDRSGHSLPSPLRGRWPFAAAKGRMGVAQTMAPHPERPPSVTAAPRHLPRKGEGQA